MVIYGLFSFIDYVVYSVASWMIQLIFDIATFTPTLFESDGGLGQRIYVLLGIVMFFKVVVSCIQLFISPDSMGDKDNGLAGMLKRIIITVALIIVVPTIFDVAMDKQELISSSIPKIILGVQELDKNEIKSTGESISIITLKSFIGINDKKGGEYKSISSSTDTKIKDLWTFKENIGSSCGGGLLDIGSWFNTSKCDYTYLPILSTIVGVFMAYIFASMAFDIAIRCFKFMILRVLAPICISSYIDPKTSEKSFKNWVHQSISVYCDLFIRMAIVYFIIYFFKTILTAGTISNIFAKYGGLRGAFITVVLIMGLLMFAKEAPKYICDLLGISDSGNIKNMFSRAGGLFGMTTAGLRDTYSAYRNKVNKTMDGKPEGSHLTGRERISALRAAARGARSSSRASLGSIIGNKGFKETMSAAKANTKRVYEKYEARKDNDVSLVQYYTAAVRNRMGIDPVVDSANRELEAAKGASDSSKSSLDYVHTNASQKFTSVAFDEKLMNPSLIADLQNPAKIPQVMTVGLDASGHEVKINVADMITTYKKDSSGRMILGADGKPVVDKVAKYSIAEVQDMLSSIVSDNTGKYTGENTKYKTQATGLLDTLQGYGDRYIINNARDKTRRDEAGINENPAFLNTIQTAISAFMKNSGNTDFGREAMKYARAQGWVDAATGTFKDEYLGDIFSYLKKQGQNVQAEQQAKIGQQAPELVAKDINEKYGKKDK